MSTQPSIGPKLITERAEPLPRLSKADLEEYRLRITALNRAGAERQAAAHAHMLIEESVKSWAKNKVKEYGFHDNAKVAIDLATGEMKVA